MAPADVAAHLYTSAAPAAGWPPVERGADARTLLVQQLVQGQLCCGQGCLVGSLLRCIRALFGSLKDGLIVAAGWLVPPARVERRERTVSETRWHGKDRV